MKRVVFSTLALLWTGVAHAACQDYAADPGQLVSLEPLATKGALPADTRQCLADAFEAAESQTTKDKISRVMMVDAYATDTTTWAELVGRHLDEVDRSDPDIAYLYAFYLFNNDKAQPAEVVKWTETALERRDIWKGATYTSRVYGLMRLRTIAANSVWIGAEKEKAGTGASAELTDRIAEERNRTKTFAREWLDFAKVSGKDYEEASKICITAASAQACGL